MRTDTEQIDGLRVLQRKLWHERRISAPIVARLGDVAALQLGSGYEVVYAVDGYDLWDKSGMLQHDVSIELLLETVKAI